MNTETDRVVRLFTVGILMIFIVSLGLMSFVAYSFVVHHDWFGAVIAIYIVLRLGVDLVSFAKPLVQLALQHRRSTV